MVAGQLVTTQPQAPPAPTTHSGPAVLPSAHILVTLFGAGVGHFSGGQGVGSELHWHVGQPFESRTWPDWQKMAQTGPQAGGGAFIVTQAQT